MSTENLISSLKAAKRQAKLTPEFGRMAIGAISRAFKHQNDLLPLNTPIQALARPYPFESRVSVKVVTPPRGHYMTTFFDIDPVSPSGRYLAVTRVPFIWRMPNVGDRAQVVVIDLEEGVAQPIYTTAGWGTQLGANVQWGLTDQILYCNDLLSGRPVGVELDRVTRSARVLDGPIYGLDAKKNH